MDSFPKFSFDPLAGPLIADTVFVKIYKDLVLLQNLLVPTEQKYKVTEAAAMGYWNTPRGDRALHAVGVHKQVDWESFAVNCKGELDAISGERNLGFAINSDSYSAVVRHL